MCERTVYGSRTGSDDALMACDLFDLQFTTRGAGSNLCSITKGFEVGISRELRKAAGVRHLIR